MVASFFWQAALQFGLVMVVTRVLDGGAAGAFLEAVALFMIVTRWGALGADSGLNVLVTPQIDTFRYDSVWDTDLRVARAMKFGAVNLRLIGDLFNVMNANTVLIRNNNVLAAPNVFNTIQQNLSPRIFRVGVVVGF